MDLSKVMKSDDAVSANFAEVFVTYNNRRYCMLMCKKFEGKASVETREIPRLHAMIKGHKPGLVDLSFTMTVYKCTEIFDDIIEEYLNTGKMPRFEVQTSNDDPAVTEAQRYITTVFLTVTFSSLLQTQRAAILNRKSPAMPRALQDRKNTAIRHICNLGGK